MPHIKSVLAGFKVVYFMESSKVRKAASKEETFGASCFFHGNHVNVARVRFMCCYLFVHS